ncbi:DUF2798 domain-containing protein [Salinibius halmophilus]|uniref:DUF2798 domain-containing protein n=1 Tax=Salinibius halmophilus TaxID=1853216 RepID=UPI000E6713AA|nr:DUF2798 domain-containing protein [Salinibius halmophilus]
MKFIPTRLASLVAGILTMSLMILLMPAVSIYQQIGALEGFTSIWLNTVMHLAPIMLPIGLLIGFLVNLAIRPLVKPNED